MNVSVAPGKYILAVSGGVDSMCLLNILAKQADVEVIVAHFNHGIRPDASQDEELVSQIVAKNGLKFRVGYGHLGSNASEEKARIARYEFLSGLKVEYHAQALITAHHQDDLIETALLNLLRGSGRRGMSAISDSEVVRPLLGIPKSKVIKYARANKLEWREDSTNSDTKLLRNYLRLQIIPKLSLEEKRSLIKNVASISRTNKELNQEIANLSQNIAKTGAINRQQFINLPSEVANEAVIYWLRQNQTLQFDRKTIERLGMAIKTGQPGTKQPVNSKLWLQIGQKTAHFTTTG